MEHMLAYHVVDGDAKVQFPMASAYGIYLPSQQDVDGLNSGYMFYLSWRGSLVYELGHLQSPSRGDRTNCDILGCSTWHSGSHGEIYD
jgi:hypothetical protein